MATINFSAAYGIAIYDPRASIRASNPQRIWNPVTRQFFDRHGEIVSVHERTNEVIGRMGFGGGLKKAFSS